MKIGYNRRKLPKISENWLKLMKMAKVDENRVKSTKIAENRQKLSRIGENSNDSIDPRLPCFDVEGLTTDRSGQKAILKNCQWKGVQGPIL
jgi:hypothetical protein